jgi:protein phosphatase
MTIHHLKTEADVEIFQLSDAGKKLENQDAIGARVPEGSLLTSKGYALVIADGVSAAEAAQEASQACVTGFLTDYFSTPDSWSVKKSALKVLQSLNRWLYGQSQSHIQGRGFLTTFSVLIIKSNTAHIFHVGDSRIYRQRDNSLEQLTTDHTRHMSGKQYYLARAMGADLSLDIDYRTENIQQGDRFLLTTDGIHDVLSYKELNHSLTAHHPNALPSKLLDVALKRGSLDNISCQLAVVNHVQRISDQDSYKALRELPFPPDLSVGNKIDGFTVKRLIQASERSQLYLVESVDGLQCVMKTPSINYEDDPAYIERFVLEEWIGSRVSSPNIVRTINPTQRKFLYYLTHYVPGPTLENLITERGKLEISDAVEITEQLVKALRALHRKETLHQDLKPGNIIISKTGAVLIDFGSCLVAGIDEIQSPFQREIALGTAEYSAPEYRYGGKRSEKSDQFSLAVVLYEMLTGEQPYGEKYEQANSLIDFQRLNYRPAMLKNPMVPLWLDGAIEKALSINTTLRYESLSEFIYDLKNPNSRFITTKELPWVEKNPVQFWRSVSIIQFMIILTLLVTTFFIS